MEMCFWKFDTYKELQWLLHNGLIDSCLDVECNEDGVVRKGNGISCGGILTRTWLPFVNHVSSNVMRICASRDSLACTTIQIYESSPNFVSYIKRI